MDVFKLENEDVKEVILTLGDFEFICRVCCLKRRDLRLFREDYLLNLFHAIRNVDVFPSIEYPRNICNGCVNELEDISIFIDTSKYNDASFGQNVRPKQETIGVGILQECKGKTERNEEDVFLQGASICRICFSPSSSLTPFEEKQNLVHLFKNITNINEEAENNSSEMNRICLKCINQLEKISSFINSSLRYDQILEKAMDTNKAEKIESFSNPINFKLPTCHKLEHGCETDGNNANSSICTGERFFPGSIVKPEMIDIKEEVIDGELVVSTAQCDQNGLQFHNEIFPEEKPFYGATSKEALKEEFPSSLNIPNRDSEDVSTQNGKALFECNWCEMRFTDKTTLQQHLFAHTGEKPFNCNRCDKSFTTKAIAKRHMHTHTGEKPFKCDCCKKSFARKSYLRLHMLIHKGEKPFKCDCCQKTFIHKSTLQRHKFAHITGEKPFKCAFCNKSFAARSHVQRHLLAHTGERPFICDRCGKSYTSKSDLKQHMLKHTGEKPFKCDSCGNCFLYRSGLQNHLLTHTGEKSFKCDRCEKSFARRYHLQQHFLTHTGEKPFKCDICGKSFTNKTDVKRHMSTHTREKKRHMATHTREKLFECDCCGQSFIGKSNLQLHMLVHSGGKPFQCDRCKKSFIYKSHLQRHMLSHTGEKPFKCDLCDRSFATKSHVQQHLPSHAVEKLFKCNCCERSFVQKQNLQQHMLTHSEEKLSNCDPRD